MTVALTLDEEALVDRASHDDEGAFAALYARHARYVAGVVFRLLGDDQDLDDVVQETFLDAKAGLHRLVDPSALRGYLVTIAVRRAHRVLARRRRRRLFAWAFADVSAKSSDPRVRQPADDLYDALDRLPEDLRVPWVLARIEELTLPEVARATSVSLATVKRRIADADARLERRLGK